MLLRKLNLMLIWKQVKTTVFAERLYIPWLLYPKASLYLLAEMKARLDSAKHFQVLENIARSFQNQGQKEPPSPLKVFFLQ